MAKRFLGDIKQQKKANGKNGDMMDELENLIKARELLNVAERRISFVISEMIPNCKYYYYDSDACEESCTCHQIDWHLKEFEPEKACVGCKFRKEK